MVAESVEQKSTNTLFKRALCSVTMGLHGCGLRLSN